MLSLRAVHTADQLRALRRDGALPPLGVVDVGPGARLGFELAVNTTLSDLDRLVGLARDGRAIDLQRLYRVEEDFARLHRMAVAANGWRGHTFWTA